MRLIFWGVALVFVSACTSKQKPIAQKENQEICLKKPTATTEGFKLKNSLIPFWEPKSKQWGYKDRTNGKIVFKPQFDEAGVFQGSLAYAVSRIGEDSLKIVRIDSSGEQSVVLFVKSGSRRYAMIKSLPSKIISIRVLDNYSFFCESTGRLLEFDKPVKNFHSLGKEGVAINLNDKWLFYDSEFEITSQLEDMDWDELFGYDILREDNEKLPLLRMKSKKTGKVGLFDFKGNLVVPPIYENISYPSADSLAVVVKDGEQMLIRLPKVEQVILPDSVSPWNTSNSYCNKHKTLIVQNEAASKEYSDYSIFLKTGQMRLLPSNSWTKLSDDFYSFQRRGKIFFGNCLGEEVPSGNSNSILGSEGIVGNKANGFPIFVFLLGNQKGVVNSQGGIVIPPTFDKIDIAESPWHFDFPYIVASRDSGIFHEVYLFGIEGDTLAGPMRLKKWSRGSAYGHNSLAEHVLNHSDWRGTPKEEMLFYIEWEDADSVLHKGYIDFFGHLYE